MTSIEKSAGWQLSYPLDPDAPRYGNVDVIPLDDLREHQLGGDCWCKPFDDDGIWSHNSADGRERFETGASPN